MKIFLLIFIRIYYEIESLFFRLIPAKRENTILFTKIDAIGDFVIWMDVAESLKSKFPDYKIAIIINRICFELVEKTNYFDEIICLDKKKWLSNIPYRLKFIFFLSKRKFIKVINPIFSRDYFFQDQLIRVLKSNQKIGYLGDYSNNKNTLKGFIKNEKTLEIINERLLKKGNIFYSELILPDSQSIMEKSRNAHFFREISNSRFLSHIPPLPFELPDLISFSHLKEKQYVVIFVGASTVRKIWPAKNYIQLIKELKNEHIVISGGKGEEYIWENLLSQDTEKTCSKVDNYIGKTNLFELFSIIKGAKYIITNDTSASHISVVTKTPSICILGGAHFGRFQPYFLEKVTLTDQIPLIANYEMECYHCNLNCKYLKDNKFKVWPCIENISSNQIINLKNSLEI